MASALAQVQPWKYLPVPNNYEIKRHHPLLQHGTVSARMCRQFVGPEPGPSEYEVIIVNDESKDRTLEIAKEYAAKYDNVKVIDKKNAGVAPPETRVTT